MKFRANWHGHGLEIRAIEDANWMRHGMQYRANWHGHGLEIRAIEDNVG